MRMRDDGAPSVRTVLFAGYTLIIVLVGGFGGYAAATKINGAVVAPGYVAVETGAKPVQHPEGGVVSEILVRDGDHVDANQIVARLDDVQTKANLGVIEEQLVRQRAYLTRLYVERDGTNRFTPSANLSTSEQAAIAAEIAQFESRKSNLSVERSILDQRITQFELAITGYEADIRSIEETHRIAKAEYASIKPLIDRGITPITRGWVLEREIAALIGRKGQRLADVAKTRDQISETRLQLLKLDGDFRAQILREIAEAEAQVRELSEKQLIAFDKLKRVDIRSPQGGSIQNIAIFAAGAVIKPSETIMLIIPKDDKLVIDAQIQPQQIDQLRTGQPAMVRLTNFNRRMTPELRAKVEIVSADLTVPGADVSATQSRAQKSITQPNSSSALPFYSVRLRIEEGEMSKLDGASLLPGMQVETLITTEERSILSYIFKPLTDRMALAFRER